MIAALVVLAFFATAMLRERTSDSDLPRRTVASAPAAQPPNILVFITDDQTIGTWSAMPRTTQLVRGHGITFTRAYVSDPSCCPSRSTILTGDWAHTTGVYTNRRQYGGFRAFYRNGNEARTIATYLDPTYDTALFGKYLNGYSSYANQLGKSGYVPPGWDNWEAFYGMNGAYYNYKLDVNGQLINYGHAPQDYSTDVIGQRLREWLDTSDGDGRNPSQPFFAYVAAFSPHAPTDASITHGDTHRFLNLPPFRSPALNERDVSDKPSYIRALPPINPLGMERLTNVWRQQHQSLFSYDRQIGLTLKLLRTEHQLRNTLVIVMSDNGETTGEHRWTYKLVPYERSIRVPLAIRYDRLIRHPGTTDSRDLVANADLFPTIASVALGPRWRPPQPVDGLSLRNVLNGTQHGQLRRSIVLENEYYARGGLKRNVPTYCGIVTRRWKYVVYSPTSKDPGLVAGSEEDELYDLEHDPFELHNLAASRPGIAARLRKRLAKACSPTPPGWDVRW